MVVSAAKRYTTKLMDALRASVSRLDPESNAGHYESWFLRANHPDQPRALWIRYTSFVPRGSRARDASAIGELWAIAFDGASGEHVAVRSYLPFSECSFARDRFHVSIGAARLDPLRAVGTASSGGHSIRWDLEIGATTAPPLLLLPEKMYDGGFPKAKALTISPLARLGGVFRIDEKSWEVQGWVGSLNHNWGSRHTDSYAWGQVAGFDDAPDVFLECATARVRLGPLRTPPLTSVVLRIGDETVALNSITETIRASGRFEPGSWRLESASTSASVEATFFAPRSDFLGLTYPNPPGGSKICLNTKIASCELALRRSGRPVMRVHTRSRAAFEILGDAAVEGIPVRV